MSSKSHIELNQDMEIYSDCNERRTMFGREIGNDIFFTCDNFYRFRTDMRFLYLQFHKGSEAALWFGCETVKIWAGHVDSISYEFGELSFTIIGGTDASKNLESKNLQYFKYDNDFNTNA